MNAATFTCTIEAAASCSSGTLLIRLNSSESGVAPNNSHAQLANYSGDPYAYSVCCSTDPFRTLSNTCTASATQVLKLYATTNSHVQAGNHTGYVFGACYDVTAGSVECEYPTDSCNAGYNQVISIASSETADDNLTNAHVGDFNLYMRKVCCRIGAQTPPTIAYVNISPNGTATTRQDLECQNGTVADADGDSVTLHYNWFMNGTSITVLNLPMSYNGSHTYDLSGFDNHGLVNGATLIPDGGYAGGEFSFDGTNDYISLPNDPELNFGTGPFSIHFAISDGSAGTKAFIDKKNGTVANVPGFIVYQGGVGTRTRFMIHNGTSSLEVSDVDSPADGTEYTYTVTRNQTGIYLYQYTALVDEEIGGGTWNLSNAIAPIIGANSSLNGMFYSGVMDEVIIFNRSLSASEVRTLYASRNRFFNGTDTGRGNVWNCSITPVDSTGLNGSTRYSNETSINGSQPEPVTLIYPVNNNQSVFERNVNFSWTAADERDGDQVNYSLNVTITPGTCSVQLQQTNFQTAYYTSQELCIDQMYNWTVRACDIEGCSTWATKFNFTIASVLSINLLNSTTEFGTIGVGQTKDTEYGGVSPFLIENDGNVIANITLNATNSPFSTSGLDNTSFQFKARANETGAFNASGSPMTYTPVHSILKNVIKQLNYSDTNDTAYVDINITIPPSEPSGDKTTNVTFRAAVSS